MTKDETYIALLAIQPAPWIYNDFMIYQKDGGIRSFEGADLWIRAEGFSLVIGDYQLTYQYEIFYTDIIKIVEIIDNEKE